MKPLATEYDGYGPIFERERMSILQAALDGVPDQYKHLLITRYLEDVKPGTIAAASDTTVTDVRNVMRRALRRLRKKLIENGVILANVL